jgi:hypothetical protein
LATALPTRLNNSFHWKGPVWLSISLVRVARKARKANRVKVVRGALAVVDQDQPAQLVRKAIRVVRKASRVPLARKAAIGSVVK